MTLSAEDAHTYAQRKTAQAAEARLVAQKNRLLARLARSRDRNEHGFGLSRIKMAISHWYFDEFGNPTRTVRRV